MSTRRTTAMPLYILSNEQLVQIARLLQEVENELSSEEGDDEVTKQCVTDLLDELDRRGDSYRLAGSKIRRV